MLIVRFPAEYRACTCSSSSDCHSDVDGSCAEDLRHLRTRRSATGTPVVDWLVATSECAMYLSQDTVLRLHEHERTLRSRATLRDVVARMRRLLKVYSVRELASAPSLPCVPRTDACDSCCGARVLHASVRLVVVSKQRHCWRACS